MIKNMLPQDSRTVEIASAWAMMMMSVGIGAHIVVVDTLMTAHNIPFWVTCLALIGMLQFWSLVIHPSAEVLRCILAWVSGIFWIWLSFADGKPSPADFSTFTLGIGNLYGFVININMLRREPIWR